MLDSLDADPNFDFTDYDADGDAWVDTPVIIIYRWMNPADLGNPIAELFNDATCYVTRDSADGDPVRIYGPRGITGSGPFYWAAATQMYHEWGHLVLGDAWHGCDVETYGFHLNTLEGFDVMDGNGPLVGTRMLSPYWRYRSYWQTTPENATIVSGNTIGAEIRPFQSASEMGDIFVLRSGSRSIPAQCECAEDVAENYFLVENRDTLSIWANPKGQWGGDVALRPCGVQPETVPGRGVVIYHVFEGSGGGSGTGEGSGAVVPPESTGTGTGSSAPNIYSRVDVESPEGLFDVADTEAGWRVLQDQVPRPFGPGGWDRLNVEPSEGDSMGRWSGRDFWNGSDSTGSAFTPYTNPGTGRYNPWLTGCYQATAPGAAQDSFTAIGVINIQPKPQSNSMLADLIVNYPSWDSLHVNTTWSGIVRLDSDLFIGTGDTLTILPGTRIVMTPWQDRWRHGSGPDTARTAIVVSGALVANGAFEDSIYFTTAYDIERLGTPTYAQQEGAEAVAGQWSGIRVASGGSIKMRFCDIGFAADGVSVSSGASSGNTVERSRIHDATKRGVFVDAGGVVVIDSCDIGDVDQGLVVANGSSNSAQVSYTRIHATANQGIFVTDGGGITVDYCDVSAGGRGIAIQTGASGCSVKHSVIHDCEDEGLFLKNSQGLRVSSNTIERNEYGIVSDKVSAVIDTNIVRLNGMDEAGLGIQMKMNKPDAKNISVIRNFFGGDRLAGESNCGEDTCFVKKGIVLDHTVGQGDTVFIAENTFKYIDETGLEVALPEFLGVGQKASVIAVGDTNDVYVRGNEFIDVNCVYDLTDARGTVFSWTAAMNFDIGIRTADALPVFGKMNGAVEVGGNNYFWEQDLEALPGTAFITVTNSISDSLYAKYCSWNALSCDDIYNNTDEDYEDYFLVNGASLPNKISITPCDTTTLFQFPWNMWPSLKMQETQSALEELVLSAPTPNPSRGLTALSFGIPPQLEREGGVVVAIYDVTGRRICALSAPHSGQKSVVWDGRDGSGTAVSSGIYFARLEVAGQSVTQRVVVLR